MMNYQNKTAIRQRCFQITAGILTLLVSPANAQEAGTQSTEDEVFDLTQLEVQASADASSAGLLPEYAGGQVASGGRLGILGALDYMSTPFNLTSYTETLIENQQAASVGEVLLNDPAVRVARGFGNFQQLYMVRGLPIYSDDMAYNGLYGLLPRQYLGTELIERVEVLRGSNTFLNGAAPGGSSLGGAVNVLPKRAPNEPLTQLTTGVQTGGQLYGALDAGHRFLDNSLGVRLTAAHRQGDTAISGESRDFSLYSMGTDYRSQNLRISADFGYQDLSRIASQPNITISAGLAIPAAPNASRSVAQPWTFSDARDLLGTLRTEYDFGENITGWFAFGTRRGEEKNKFANPTVSAADGTSSAYRFDNVRNDDVATGEIGIRAKLMTGTVSHSITASAAHFELASENAYAFSAFTGFANNIYAPSPVIPPSADAFIGGTLDNPLVTERAKTTSYAIADMVSLFQDQLLVTAGLRHQQIENYSYDYNTGAQISAYSKSKLTPVGGILYKLTSNYSLYVNYIEGLTRGEIAPATSGGTPVVNAGEAMKPYTTKQFEAGVKFDWSSFGGALSVYQSEKPVSGVDSSGRFGLIDDQRNRGIELTVYGEPFNSLRVLGGISYINTDIQGNDSIGAPSIQTNVGAEWAVPGIAGLTIDGRMIYTSSQYADSANTQKVPSWTRFDLGLRYTFNITQQQQIILRGRVENVADKDYWASAGGYPGAGYLTVGAPRTFIVSATLEF